MTGRLTSVINVQCILYLMGEKLFCTIIKIYYVNSDIPLVFLLKVQHLHFDFFSQIFHQYNTSQPHTSILWSFPLDTDIKIKFIIKTDNVDVLPEMLSSWSCLLTGWMSPQGRGETKGILDYLNLRLHTFFFFAKKHFISN